MQRSRMKKCVFLVSLAGLLCLLTPSAAHAGVPQWPQAHRSVASHSALRKAPRPPRQDKVRRGGLDGSLALIQFISTRKSDEQRRHHRIAPPDSAAQVRASRDDAERESLAALTARSVDSLPPHWGATHLCI